MPGKPDGWKTCWRSQKYLKAILYLNDDFEVVPAADATLVKMLDDEGIHFLLIERDDPRTSQGGSEETPLPPAISGNLQRPFNLGIAAPGTGALRERV